MWYDDGWNISVSFGDYGKPTRKKLAQYKNFKVFQNTFFSMCTDALTRFEIEGIPSTCRERVILQSLLWYANFVIFEKDGNVFALPGVPSGKGLNINGDPGGAWVFSRNGLFNKEINLFLPGSDVSSFLKKTNGISEGEGRGVIVWENSMRYPFINTVIWYAEQIADTLRTVEVGRRWLKKPVIAFAEESVIETVRGFWNKIADNEEMVIGTGIYDPKKVSLEQIQYNGANLTSCTQLVEWYQSKFRELCGIESNSQIDKKGENLIEAEVAANSMFTELSIEKCLPIIQEGLDDANRIFGLNMKVKKRELNLKKENQEDEEEKGDANDEEKNA